LLEHQAASSIPVARAPEKERVASAMTDRFVAAEIAATAPVDRPGALK